MRLGLTFAAVLVLLGASGCGETSSGQAAAPAAGPPLTEAEKKALVAALPSPYDQGNLANGEAAFAVCRSCHTLAEGGPAMTGPNLHGVFGRKAGAADYRYSDQMKASPLVWDAHTLDSWIADPRAMIPGTRMSFPGIRDATDRRDLVAYLKAETSPKP